MPERGLSSVGKILQPLLRVDRRVNVTAVDQFRRLDAKREKLQPQSKLEQLQPTIAWSTLDKTVDDFRWCHVASANSDPCAGGCRCFHCS